MHRSSSIRRRVPSRTARWTALAVLVLTAMATVSIAPAQQPPAGPPGSSGPQRPLRTSIPRVVLAAQRLFTSAEPSPEEGEYFGLPGSRGDVLQVRPREGPMKLTSWLPAVQMPCFCGAADPNDPYRHVGRGQPLVGTSWLNRPMHVGWMIGGIVPGNPTGNVNQDGKVYGGFRFGKDFDHYWGCELRFAFSHPELIDDLGTPVTSHSDLLFYDAHMLYYPWGDARWRPYVALGLGMASIELTDANNVHYDELLFHLPVGCGVKWQWKPWLALRVDVHDNIAFGSAGINTMHNFTATFGAEMHLGHHRRLYYPWHPGIRHW